MTIVEFLTARINDDAEQLAKAAGGPFAANDMLKRAHREVDAKRAIVDYLAAENGQLPDKNPGLRALAAVWNDHTDYNARWRPHTAKTRYTRKVKDQPQA